MCQIQLLKEIKDAKKELEEGKGMDHKKSMSELRKWVNAKESQS